MLPERFPRLSSLCQAGLRTYQSRTCIAKIIPTTAKAATANSNNILRVSGFQTSQHTNQARPAKHKRSNSVTLQTLRVTARIYALLALSRNTWLRSARPARCGIGICRHQCSVPSGSMPFALRNAASSGSVISDIGLMPSNQVWSTISPSTLALPIVAATAAEGLPSA